MIHQPFNITRAGMTLRGSVYRPDDERRRPAVVLLHGFTGHRMETGYLFVQLARALHEHGVVAVTFDFLHCGESDGSFDQMLVSGQIDDALRVVEWVQRRPYVDRSRLGLIGFSLGGLVGVCVQARSNACRALALLAPTTSDNLARIARGADDQERIRVGPHTLHPAFFDDLLALDATGEAARHPVPTLLAQGSEDTAVPPAVSGRYADAITRAGGPVQHVNIAGADHGFSRPAWRGQLIPATSGFFAEHL